MTIYWDILKFSLIMYPPLKDIRGIMYLENAGNSRCWISTYWMNGINEMKWNEIELDHGRKEAQ